MRTSNNMTLSAAFPHFGAFESTKLHGSGTDILGTTRHIEFCENDLGMLLDAGLRDLRYSIPWHRIERLAGEFDFTWMDVPMRFMERNGMSPVVDPLHHVSFPDWLEGGFFHPLFPKLYERFVLEFARRYPWVRRFTVFNEPLPTTIFCSLNGTWYPHRASEEDFVTAALAAARSIAITTASLKRLDPANEFVHIDTCESHRSLERKADTWTAFAMERRFLMHDLVLGRVSSGHPLYEFLIENGAPAAELSWLQDNPGLIDVIGLDYYPHSEMEWRWRGREQMARKLKQARGFAAVARDYIERYQLPVMLGETNIRGSVNDRIAWLKFMQQQCEELVRDGVDFRGFCWYPSIDSTDWCHLCTKMTGTIDPQGIWSLCPERTERRATELSHLYRGLAQGEITWRDLPSRGFDAPWEERLVAFEPLLQSLKKAA